MHQKEEWEDVTLVKRIKLNFMPSSAFHLQMSTRSELIFKNAFVKFDRKSLQELALQKHGPFSNLDLVETAVAEHF